MSITTSGTASLATSVKSQSATHRSRNFPAEFLVVIGDDVSQLLDTFLASRDTSFASFNEIWRRVDFSLVYTLGFTHLSTIRIIEHVYDVLLGKFEASMNSNGMLGREANLRSAIIFFLYHMYFTQPCGDEQIPLPIPISIESYKKLQEIYTLADNEVAYVLYRLFTNDAFQLAVKGGDSAIRRQGNEQNFASAGLGTSDLMEEPTKNLRDQVRRIDAAMQRDPLVTGNYGDVLKTSNEYDTLVDRFAGEVAPELLAGPAWRQFSHELERIRTFYAERNVTIGRASEKSARKKAMTRPNSPAGRKSTVVAPIRPDSCPPLGRARSASTSNMEVATDMPDLTFFDL
jgi:hypothetical protein